MNDADKVREKCTGNNMLETRRHKQKMSEQSFVYFLLESCVLFASDKSFYSCISFVVSTVSHGCD